MTGEQPARGVPQGKQDRWHRLAVRAPLGWAAAHIVVGLIGVGILTAIMITSSTDEERAEWREVVLTWVVAYDLVALASTTLVHWLPRLLRHRAGTGPVVVLDWYRMWASIYAVILPVGFLYVMLFREKGAPAWIIGFTMAVALNALIAELDWRREARKVIRAARSPSGP